MGPSDLKAGDKSPRQGPKYITISKAKCLVIHIVCTWVQTLIFKWQFMSFIFEMEGHEYNQKIIPEPKTSIFTCSLEELLI